MARRNVRPDRAWFASSSDANHTVTTVTDVAQLVTVISFADISVDEVMVQRERSDWYFERFIMWYWIHFTQVTESTDRLPVVLTKRLGTTNETDTGMDALQWGTSLDHWQRILHDDVELMVQRQPFTFVTDKLITATGNADRSAYSDVPKIQKIDIDAKFRIAEDSLLGFWMGTEDAQTGDTVHLEYWFKALLRRGR